MNLGELRRNWETLAREDPLWAVYVKDGTKGGRWDLEEFLRTGADEVRRSKELLRRHGREISGTVLDFGSGVGRLSRPLSESAEHVVGVDISTSMIRLARELCSDRPNVRYVVSDAPVLPVRTASIDVVYSSLVLQHMPRPLALGYVVDFMRVLRPGGLAVIQVAVSPRMSVKGLAFRLLPAAWYSRAQRRLLGYPAPMRMQAIAPSELIRVAVDRGGSVLTVAPDPSYGGDWTYARVVLVSDGPG